MAAKQKVVVPELRLKRLHVDIEGQSSMIHHGWDPDTIEKIKGKQSGAASTGKAPRNPEKEFAACAHIIDEKPGDRDRVAKMDFKGIKFGFPSVGFKAAIVSSCRSHDMFKMTEARSAFHIEGDMVEIKSDPPIMRQDMVRFQMTTDVRYRPEFRNWRATLPIIYDADVISPEQLIVMINKAGFGVGVGEWRPEKDGPYGRFAVVGQKVRSVSA